MSLPKPSTEKRHELLRTALSPLDSEQSEKLFDAVDVLFESVLTNELLLHDDADNPVEHHMTVLNHMMRIAKGQGFSWNDTCIAAAVSVLHDIQPVPRITREMREGARTAEEKAALELKNTENRIIHMGLGSSKADAKLRAVNKKLGKQFFAENDIRSICGLIAVHDIPSLDLPIPAHARMAVAFREADRLWMQTRDGVRADLARKEISNPTEQQCLEQANKNLASYRKERSLYNSSAEDFKDEGTFFRTNTGYAIYEELRSQWHDCEGR